MDRPRSVVGALLATSSVVAMIAAGSGPARAACAAIGSSGFTNPIGTTIPCASASNTVINGNVVNAGTISPGSAFGISINGGTLNGAIVNSGTITTTTPPNPTGNGVFVFGAIVTGGISNSGSITSSGRDILVQATPSFGGGITNTGTLASVSTSGIQVFTVSTFTGGITNSGTITPSGIGILVDTVSTFTGGIVNSGTITSSPTQAGISVNNVRTFVGGINNSGTLSGAGASAAIIVNQVGSFGGGITNTGHIAFTGSGSSVAAIGVVDVSVFSGGISNAGTITAANGAGVRVGITFSTGSIHTASTFSGGIANVGTITAQTGIIVLGSQAFSGGISNSGTISVSGAGIQIGSVTIGGSSTTIIAPVQSFSGGITNTGTIAGNVGIHVIAGTTFGGGISNAGLITGNAGAGIQIGSITGSGAIVSIATFSGGIVNSGTIHASGNGIDVFAVTSFSNGITNSGTIAANGVGGRGIIVNAVSTLSGGISNSGTIAANGANGKGISVNAVSTFTGGINNSGSISAQSFGIVASAVSFSGGMVNSGTINSGNVAMYVVTSGSFAGGMLNTGTIISGASGIGAAHVSSFAGGITNAGRISAAGTTGGIFLQFVSAFSGGITNTGTISASIGPGIVVKDATATFLGGITNSGTISGVTGIAMIGGVTFSGAIANSGNITGTGGTAIDVSAAPNAMTINQSGGIIAGAIKLSPFADAVNVSGGTINGNIVGQGASNTVNFALGNGTFIYDSPFSISGIHQLNVNSGLVILDGSNAAANVAVNGGILEVGDASHPAAMLTATNGLTIAAGGTLEGHGTVVGNIGIPTGATLAPGGSIGTLNVTGNLSLATGSFYDIAVTAAGQNSKTVATGTATIAGGTVEVMEQPGTYPPSFKYTILTANGGVNGTFTNATSDFAFLTPVLSYDANDVFLTLSRNATFFQSLAQTPNQHSVGAALDASPLGSALLQPVLFQTAAGARQAFDALSGEVHGSVQSTLIDDSHYMRQAILGRLRQAGFTHAPDAMAALGFAGPVTVEGSGESPALGYASASGYPVKAAPRAAPALGSDVAFWSQGVAATGRIDGDSNAASAKRDLTGFFSGFDARFGEFARLGLAGGYSHSSLSVDARASSAGIDTAHLGGYAGATFGAVNLRAGAAYAFHTIDTSRTIVFPGFFDSAKARYDGGTGQIFGEIGYGVALGRIAAEPFVGLAWVHLRTDGFAETGGVAALNGAASGDDVGYSTLGARLATSYLLPNGMALIPRASAAWQHAFNDIAPTAALAFQNTGAGFSIAGVPLARDAALVETALDLRVNPHAKLGLSYSGQLAGHLQDHAVKGNFTWNF
jgi:outer membrane autotransporter protein